MVAVRHLPAVRRAADGAARELAPDLTIIQALMRMRCRTCRGRVEAAILDNNLSGWRGRAVRIWGPGSYG